MVENGDEEGYQTPRSSSSASSDKDFFYTPITTGNDNAARKPEWKKRKEETARLIAARAERQRQQQAAAEKIDQDETLDDAAKIDAMAVVRGWFIGDTTVIDRYLAGEIDAAEAAAILAKPIDECYSTADHGAAYWKTERQARCSRARMSEEEALEKVSDEDGLPDQGCFAEFDAYNPISGHTI